jgi:hypothetical protein
MRPPNEINTFYRAWLRKHRRRHPPPWWNLQWSAASAWSDMKGADKNTRRRFRQSSRRSWAELLAARGRSFSPLIGGGLSAGSGNRRQASSPLGRTLVPGKPKVVCCPRLEPSDRLLSSYGKVDLLPPQNQTVDFPVSCMHSSRSPSPREPHSIRISSRLFIVDSSLSSSSHPHPVHPRPCFIASSWPVALAIHLPNRLEIAAARHVDWTCTEPTRTRLHATSTCPCSVAKCLQVCGEYKETGQYTRRKYAHL